MTAISPVLDASVLVAALVPTEARHLAARQMLAESSTQAFIVPSLFVIEVVAALARRGAPPELLEGARALCESRRIRSLALDEPLIDAALELAVRAKLRGADALYAGLALLEGAPLYTLDVELAARLEGYPGVEVRTAPASG